MPRAGEFLKYYFTTRVSTRMSKFACWSTSRAAFEAADPTVIQVQWTDVSEWGSVCAQHATIAQALPVCPYVEDGEIFTLW